MERTPILEACDLRKVFRAKGKDDIVAVDGASFQIHVGQSVALVGGSGCGKSTTARMLVRLTDATSGRILLHGRDMTHTRRRELRTLYDHVQMVFQNPTSSFDPRRTLGHGIAEGLLNRGVSKAEARIATTDLLEQCGLDASFADRYPGEVSGGQCQRAAIARALAVGPELLICDEATSALDVTVQNLVVRMLADIQRDRRLALFFICHDLALVQGFCERVMVMQAGRIVEEGPTAGVLAHPQHEYTQRLVLTARA